MNRFAGVLALAPTCLVSCCLIARAGQAAAAASQDSPAQQRIVIGSHVRVRASPAARGPVVATLHLGAIVNPSSPPVNEATPSAAEPSWIRVASPDGPGGPEGKAGWVWAGSTLPFDPASRDAIYRRIARSLLKSKTTSYADLTDLIRFLSRARREVKDAATRAELELDRLLALQRAADSIPQKQEAGPEQTPVQRRQLAWARSYKGELYYNELNYAWTVNTDLFWKLQKRYRALPIAEKIAWEAARLYWVGECEGDPTCCVGDLAETLGRYLTLYPRGAHAGQGMRELVETLKADLGLLQTPREYFGDNGNAALTLLAGLRAAVLRTASAHKHTALELLEVYIDHYH